MPWGQEDSNKKPVGNGCRRDMEIVADVFPHLTWDQAAQAMHDASQKAVKMQLLGAIQIYEARQAGKAYWFKPASDVQSVRSRVTTTYFEVAFFTEADILRLTNCSPQTLGLKSKTTITIEDGTTLSGFLVSMRGLPADEIAAARKVKIEAKVVTQLVENVLQKEHQLRAEQPMEIYEVLAVTLSENPNWVKPSARKNLQSHASLLEKAEGIQQDWRVLFPLFFFCSCAVLIVAVLSSVTITPGFNKIQCCS